MNHGPGGRRIDPVAVIIWLVVFPAISVGTVVGLAYLGAAIARWIAG